MSSLKISGQITVHACEHPELFRFMSENKNKQLVSRTLQTMLETAFMRMKLGINHVDSPAVPHQPNVLAVETPTSLPSHPINNSSQTPNKSISK